MSPKEGFFKIKPQLARENPKQGAIYVSEQTIVALNINPASFGHVILFPKEQTAKDFNAKTTDNNYVLSPTQRQDFFTTLTTGIQTLQQILSQNPQRIIEIYQSWIDNDNLMNKIPGCKQRLQNTIQNFQKQTNHTISSGYHFENRGPLSGRMISTFHTQYVPNLLNHPGEVADAIYMLTNEDQSFPSSTFLTQKDILEQKDTYHENEHFRAVIEPNVCAFGHLVLTWKNPHSTTLSDLGAQKATKRFEFLNTIQNKLIDDINNHPELFFDQYRNSSSFHDRRKKILQHIGPRRQNNTWKLPTEAQNKGISNFYNGGGAFGPLIQDPRVYHFLPRFSFDNDKKGTGTAIWKMIQSKT